MPVSIEQLSAQDGAYPVVMPGSIEEPSAQLSQLVDFTRYPKSEFGIPEVFQLAVAAKLQGAGLPGPDARAVLDLVP